MTHSDIKEKENAFKQSDVYIRICSRLSSEAHSRAPLFLISFSSPCTRDAGGAVL